VRVFVAGGTGVLGRVLLPRLIAGGHSVRAIARRVRSTVLPAEVELIEADLLEDDLLDLVRGCDAVVHIATAIPADASAPRAWDLTGRLRTSGTRRLLNATLAAQVPRYVQQTIVMAYRDGGDAWLDEQTPLDQSSARAATCGPVIEMEATIRDIDPRRLAWTILRGGSFVGPGTQQSDLIEELRLGAAVVHGDGSNYLSAVNVADMASGFVVVLERAPEGSTFNIVDEPLRYGAYVDAPRRPDRRPAVSTSRAAAASLLAMHESRGAVRSRLAATRAHLAERRAHRSVSERSPHRHRIKEDAPGAPIGLRVAWGAQGVKAGTEKEIAMDTFDPYASILAVLSVSLLLIAAGVGTKQLVWERRRPLPVRIRRRRS
jgi:2-alkyl-3-oxoalkanoate reductase